MSLGSKNEDRLSNLPEEVLSHILSLMPTKYAVRSCILSKRWRHSWMMVTNLDFNDLLPVCDFDRFLKFVDRVLELFKPSQVNLFKLHFARYPVPKSSMTKWIDKAIELNVSELDIYIPRLELELPLSLFNCQALTKLSLFASNYRLDVFNALPLVILPSLKTLDIDVHNEPSVNAFKFIHGCPVLENLSLAISPRDNKDYNFNIPTLKRLELTTRNCISTNKVVLNVPNLEYLSIDEMWDSQFVMEDLSSLVEAAVYFSSTRFNNLGELLKGISGVKSLSWFILTRDVPENIPLPKFPNLKYLNLKGYCPFRWPLVFQLLESCYVLEHLCIEEVGKSCWIEPESIPTCILSNLRTMKITRCKGWNRDTRFIEYILGSADVLETLTITCESLCMKDELRLFARLLKIPRASRICKIHFIGEMAYTTST